MACYFYTAIDYYLYTFHLHSYTIKLTRAVAIDKGGILMFIG